ncbi:MAG: tetratricopeptide repeat protein [Lachnospiraceae bacterium]|nr:tetratricopeptide repeat protein [Lachnospiraceae bacterium]
MIWKILEIEKTKDEEVIKKAYRDKLPLVNPEDDAEGFKELRRAYEEALDYASRDESEEELDEESNQPFQGKKNDVDLWIDKVDRVYRDVKTRIDELCWKELFKDSVCENLDTEMEAAEKLLVYFMSHSNMPQAIWKLIDNRFQYMENVNSLKEKFPENYLDFVKWQIQYPGFIDYSLFGGKTDDNVDEFINKIYEVRSVASEGDLSRVKQLLKELNRFDVEHPFVQVEEARCHLLEAELLEKESPESTKEQRDTLVRDALSIMEDLDFEYSENLYVERIYGECLIKAGEIAKAKVVYDTLLERDEENQVAVLGKAECMMLEGAVEDAKELIEDVLEDHVQDSDSLALLDRVNLILVEQYEEALKKEMVPDICYKLGWCYYQQKKFEEGIKMLDDLGEQDSYEYVNLRCRLYLANDDYEQAKPWAEKWLELIEATVDDGSREMTRRMNRRSLAHFSLGICEWEIHFKHCNEDEKESAAKRVEDYLNLAIEEETNRLVSFSYMEQLARFLVDAGKYEECIETCNRILEEDRGFFPAYVHRQKAHYKLKNAKEVIDDYFACVELYPVYAPPYCLAAEVFYAFEQYDDVEQVISAAKEAGIDSDTLELYKIRCMHYKEFSKENTEQALKLMKELQKRIQEHGEESDIEDMSDVVRECAILHWDVDDVMDALDTLEEGLKVNPDNVNLLYLKVDILNRENRSEMALETCKHLERLEPDNLQVKHKIANCYEYMKKLDEAIKVYEKILSVDEEYVPSLRRMMYVYSYLSEQNGDLDACKMAVSYATRFIELTDAAEGYVERGNLYIDMYELENAVADCKKAIELDEDAYYAYNNLGCALLKLRRVKEAIEPLKQAVAMDPDKEHLPYLNLAECYVLLEEYDTAIKMYREVLRLRPNAKKMWREIAIIYTRAKQYDKAIEVYEKMVADAKESKGKTSFLEKLKKRKQKTLTDEDIRLQMIYCDIADVYRQKGDYKAAEDCYNKMILKNPDLVLCVAAAGKIAEFYRDIGQMKKAHDYLHYMESHTAKEDLGTGDYEHLDFIRTTVYYELGDRKNATICADRFLTAFLKRRGGEEKMLRDERYRRMLQYVLVVMHACAGRMEQAKKYLTEMRPCKLCVTCEAHDCYEFYFATGLIAEMEGRNAEAIENYKKAIILRGEYGCAQLHLEQLLKKV